MKKERKKNLSICNKNFFLSSLSFIYLFIYLFIYVIVFLNPPPPQKKKK